jgi:hypothetical protein
MSNKCGRCVSDAKQNPHRPGIAPALGLCAGSDGPGILSQTASWKETLSGTGSARYLFPLSLPSCLGLRQVAQLDVLSLAAWAKCRPSLLYLPRSTATMKLMDALTRPARHTELSNVPLTAQSARVMVTSVVRNGSADTSHCETGVDQPSSSRSALSAHQERNL